MKHKLNLRILELQDNLILKLQKLNLLKELQIICLLNLNCYIIKKIELLKILYLKNQIFFH